MFDNLKELKDRIIISDIVGHFIKLKKVGNTETACCPFHNEKSASFSIHKSKNGYKCFGCGKAGDAIDFVMEYNKLSFVDAVRAISDIIGFKLEEESKVIVKPTERLEKLSKEFLNNFENVRKISNNTLLRFGITESVEWMPKAQKEIKVICFNYYKNGELVNIKFRGKDKDMRLSKDAELIFYNIDSIKDETECVIVEGEIDCLSCHEAKIYNSISVPNGANTNYKYLDNSYEFFTNKEKIIIAVDNDKAGLKLKEELLNRFGKERCYIVEFPNDCKDANDVLVKYGNEYLRECIVNAKSINIDGIVPTNERKDNLFELYKDGVPRGTPAGIYGLDDLIRFQGGLLTVITGSPGCFGENQLIHTSLGVKKISELKIGDFVLSYNHENDKNEYRKVLDTPVHYDTSNDIYEIELIDGTKIEVTGNHKFFTGMDYVKIEEILLSL